MHCTRARSARRAASMLRLVGRGLQLGSSALAPRLALVPRGEEQAFRLERCEKGAPAARLHLHQGLPPSRRREERQGQRVARTREPAEGLILPMLPTRLSQKRRRSISPLTQLGIGGASPFLGKPRR